MKAFRFFLCFWIMIATCDLFSDDRKPDAVVQIPMRDGKLLPTDIYLPSPDAKGLPCILLRSPAGKESPFWKGFSAMADAGYVVAIQDTRNVLDVQGKTFPFLTDGWGRLQDGYDTVEWLAKSPYTNGQIGTWGSSALGITQLLMAPAAPPSLKCQYIIVAASSLYHHGLFTGGQMLKHQAEGWLGHYARDTGILNYVCQRPFYNEFWRQLNTVEMAGRVRVPGMHVGGWYDTFIQGTLSAFESRQNRGGEGAKGKQKLVIGPWTHFWPVSTHFGDFEIPAAGMQPPYDISAKAWFDHYLKGSDNGIESLPPIIYYVMGPFDGSPSSGNAWRTAENWPIPAKNVSLFLTPDGGLQHKETFEGILSYLYDPHNPTPTIGGHNLFLESGPKDQRSIEERLDVLVFTTDPLEADVEVTGNLSAKLFVTTNQEDTDFVVRFCDVYPDGRSILISEGIYRLAVMCAQERHQRFAPKIIDRYFPVKMEADKPVEIDVELWATSMVFAKGHKIRISVTSSNYPRYEKNMNVGLIGGNLGLFNVAKNTIYMGPRYPSALILPVVEHKQPPAK